MATATPTADAVQATIERAQSELGQLEADVGARRGDVTQAEIRLTALEADSRLGADVSDQLKQARRDRDRAVHAVAEAEVAVDRQRAVLAELTSRERSARNIELDEQRQEVEDAWREAYGRGGAALAAFTAAARELLALAARDEQVARTRAQLDAPGAYIARGRLGWLRSQLIYIDDLDEREIARAEATWKHMRLPDAD